MPAYLAGGDLASELGPSELAGHLSELNLKPKQSEQEKDGQENMEYSPNSSWRGEANNRSETRESVDANVEESPASSWIEDGSRNDLSDLQILPTLRNGSATRASSASMEFQQTSANNSSSHLPDDSSGIDVEVQAKQLRARERVAIHRAKVLRTRNMMQHRRRTVKQLRETAREASGRLMKKLHEIMAVGDLSNLEIVNTHYQNMLRAQDDLGPVEEDYDGLERRLIDEEEDLEEEEDHFYRHYEIEYPTVSDSQLDLPLSPLIKPYEPPDDDEISSEGENGDLEEYMRKLDEAEMLKHELDELQRHQDLLVEEYSFRRSKEISLSKEEQVFLASFPQVYHDTHNKLLRTEEAVLALRKQCLEQEFFAESEYEYERRDSFSDDLLHLVHETRERSPLTSITTGTQIHESEGNIFSDKRKYVNRWLLEWVQDSAVEALQLRAWIYFECPDAEKERVDMEWPKLALRMWDVDKAGEDAKNGPDRSRMDAIYGDTAGRTETKTKTRLSGSVASFAANFGDAGGAEEILLSSEAGSLVTQKELPKYPPLRRRSSSI